VTRLLEHPFTIIGLSDREKFHTGLLAHTLRSFLRIDRDLGIELISKLWGTDNSLAELQNAEKIEVFVEEKSVDLGIRTEKEVILFAEMKLKTRLADHQLREYRAKYPRAVGVVLGLLREPTGQSDISSRPFPRIVSQLLEVKPFAKYLSEADADSVILIRMWREYLMSLSDLAVQFEMAALAELMDPNKLEEMLRSLKLKGIFESYRYRLIRSKLERLKTSAAIREFNTNGNAGLHMFYSGGLPFGLQWQAGSLKLFVEDPTYKKGRVSKRRDELLQNLTREFCREFGLNQLEKLNRNGKFRSASVERWNIFENCEERANLLNERLRFLDARKYQSVFEQH
jgi:hypothetical protein